MHLEHEEIIF